jgi:hypothetical protein
MSKVAVALAAFIAGACSVVFISGKYISIMSAMANQPWHQAESGTAPIIPSLGATRLGVFVSNGTQSLDGLDCENCSFSNVTLEYSGGAFNLKNSSFAGPVRVKLEGAAANTVAFLQLVQALRISERAKQPALRKPVQKLAIVTKKVTGDFEAPYFSD